MQFRQFTAIIECEGEYYVAICPELNVASQGQSVEEARQNVIEAVQLFLETASLDEIQERMHSEMFITQVGVPVA